MMTLVVQIKKSKEPIVRESSEQRRRGTNIEGNWIDKFATTKHSTLTEVMKYRNSYEIFVTDMPIIDVRAMLKPCGR